MFPKGVGKMKFDKKTIGREWIPYTIAACSAVVVFLVLSHLGDIWRAVRVIFSYIAPVFRGIVIAYVIDALVMFFERRVFKNVKNLKRRRIHSVILSLLLILALLTLFAVSLFPQLIGSIRALVSNLGTYVLSLQQSFDKPVLEFGNLSLDISSLVDYGEMLVDKLTSGLQENIGRILNTSVNIGKGFFNSVICCILAIYFLLSKESLLEAVKKLMWLNLDEQRYRQIADVGRQCNRILVRYIACDLLDALVVGAANFLFMSILGMPYAVLVSVVVALTNLVPTFGPLVGGAIGAFILLLANPGQMIWFLIFTVILQTIDGYIIKPHLFGDSLGVSPLWVLVAVIIGGRIFGVWGIMLAIPFAAITDFILRDIVWVRLSDHQKAHRDPTSQIIENAKNQINLQTDGNNNGKNG